MVETSKVAYQQQDQLAETEEPVKFRMGPASGTALGIAYDIRDDWLELKHDVVMDLGQGSGKGSATVPSTWRRPRCAMTRRAAAWSWPARWRSPRATAAPLPTTPRWNWTITIASPASTWGNAKAFDVNPLRNVEMSADRVEGDFDPATGELHHLTAENHVAGESKGRGSISRLTAERFDMDLGGKHPQPLRGVARGMSTSTWSRSRC